MSSPEFPFHLWLATDDTRTIVALAPLKITGAQVTHEWGSVTDLRALPSNRQTPNYGGLVVLVVMVVVGTLALCALRAPVLVALFLAVLALGVGGYAVLKTAPPGHVVAPDLKEFPEIHRVIESETERETFRDLVTLAERAGRTVPALRGVVEPTDAGETLAQALWEGANLLARRDRLRAQAVGPARQPRETGVPAGPAADYLAGQRERAKDQWNRTKDELARLQIALEAAAVAGENLPDDRDALGAARAAYRELADLYGIND